MNLNISDVIIIIVIAILFILAIREIVKRKGKCAYCKFENTCPFKVKEK